MQSAPSPSDTGAESPAVNNTSPDPSIAVLNPESEGAELQPSGSGGVRVLIFTQADGAILQCQIGQINCLILQRRPGTGLR
ncbi:MAG TPA: hypothetical protein VJZ27_09455 [Aggregatilineales bacterium]|nr:hypothetical protein [Aggregatilineales bacterium]